LDAETGVKITLRDRKCHRRPKERNDTARKSPQNGLSGVGAGFRGLEELDGGRDWIELVTPSLVRAQNYDQKRFPTMVVGHAIAALEARHETKLFDRIGRRIALTEAGRVFLMEARAILARAGAAELALSEFGTLKRAQLCVQASQTIAGYWLPRPSGGISARLPRPWIQRPHPSAGVTLMLLFIAAQRISNVSATPGRRLSLTGFRFGFADPRLGAPVFRDVLRDRAVWRRKDRGSIPARYLRTVPQRT